jgi:hypothetical protein
VFAACPPRKRVIGGGAWSASSDLILTDSYPVTSSSWQAVFKNVGPDEVKEPAEIYVICATID